ncbi:MAG: glucose-1-phosphate adenylyltransferase subunit GlgD [Lagierella massiliensis]|nr:glucose-1-phosphate adenylyltransferase subunit GlgD [Lagierella massiliensis]
MQDCIGVIIGGKSNDKFSSLCKTRPAYMLPFAGRYRLIDFTLSNLANNDLSNVLLYGGSNLRSTLDHIGNGKSWELNRRRNGLLIFPEVKSSVVADSAEIGMFFETLKFFEDAKEEYLYFVDPMVIDKEDLTEAYDRMVYEDLDVLLFYVEQEDSLGKYIGERKLIFDENGNLKKIGTNLGTEESFPMLIRDGFMKKEVFIKLVKKSVEKSDAKTLLQAISNNLTDLKVGIYKEDTGVEIIRDLKSFYDANMKLLEQDLYDKLFYENGVVLTKSKDEPSTFYGENAKINNSLIANGCKIDGYVENSIIFRGVEVKQGAVIKNSILFQKTKVERDAVVVNAITDKGACICEEVSIAGSRTAPYVVEKYFVVEN